MNVGGHKYSIKGNQSWIFIGRTGAEAQAPLLWPPDGKSELIGKYPDAGKDWEQEKGMTEDEMVGWHHWLNEHECEQTPGYSERLGYCSTWGRKESDMTLQLNNNKHSVNKNTPLCPYKWFRKKNRKISSGLIAKERTIVSCFRHHFKWYVLRSTHSWIVIDIISLVFRHLSTSDSLWPCEL